jgi:predicted phosphodiesterase
VKYLVISDMHGNWAALRTVLRKVRRKRFDAILVLGDLVGYGAAPNQVVEAVRDLTGRVVTVRGNHDKVVAGIDSGETFNESALIAAQWTAEHLTRQNLQAVRELAEGPVEVDEGLAICHGAPIDEDKYLFSDRDAVSVFRAWRVPLTFFGHTHVTSLFSFDPDRREIDVRALPDEGSLDLREGVQYLFNPGSVGQPRDRDPRASYMIYDSDRRRVRWFRLEYPIEETQQRILEAGLPAMLAHRLAAGI